MKYDQLIIYYFSGTGNAKNAALWISQIAQDEEIETHLINIDRFESVQIPEPKGKALIGFCYPTHGFNLPPIMLKFIRKFPALKNTDVFLLNTRGGLKLSKFYLPGLSGIAQILPASILMTKGYKIVGMQPLDLPSNWLLLHPGLKENVVESIHNRCKRITQNFGSKLLEGKRRYKALLSLPIDIALSPISLGYFFIGRFFLSKTLVASSACNNCEVCLQKCPVQAIKVIDNRLFWTHKCESCMRCVNSCPHRAIETSHGFSILLVILSSIAIIPVFVFGLETLGIKKNIDQSFVSGTIWFLIESIIFVLFVFVSYRIMHLLMRIKAIRSIITFTSLSHYKFWRRYKAPKAF